MMDADDHYIIHIIHRLATAMMRRNMVIEIYR